MTAPVASPLIRRIRITRGCRFNAATRLKSRDIKINIIIAILSVAIIVLGVVPKYISKTDEFNSISSLLSVFFSMIIVVFSLVHASNKDAARAAEFHRCAIELSHLLDRIQIKKEEDQKIASDYVGILSRYENHDHIDFQKYKYMNSFDFHPSVYSKDSLPVDVDFNKSIRKLGVWVVINEFWFWAVIFAILSLTILFVLLFD